MNSGPERGNRAISESRERSAPVPASGTVHWIGAGLSTGSGLAALCDTADRVRL